MKLAGMLGRTGANRPIATNLWARITALGALMVSSLLVARIGGPALVGVFVLLRMVPWLAGVLTTGGLYGAAPYFLAAEKLISVPSNRFGQVSREHAGGIDDGVVQHLSPVAIFFRDPDRRQTERRLSCRCALDGFSDAARIDCQEFVGHQLAAGNFGALEED